MGRGGKTMDLREETYLTGQWWVLTIQGIAAILFGIAAVFWPGLTLVSFIYLFGLYLLVAGVVAVLGGLFSINKRGTWVLSVLLGLVLLGIGVYLLRHPATSFALLIVLTGSALVVWGVVEVVVALSKGGLSSTSKTIAIMAGVVAVIAGVLMFFQPAASGIAFVWVVGLFALINGPLWIALSLDVKRIHDELPVKKR
jgi:uncharacterized membrane protein HdeD (DUF308 family)